MEPYHGVCLRGRHELVAYAAFPLVQTIGVSGWVRGGTRGFPRLRRKLPVMTRLPGVWLGRSAGGGGVESLTGADKQGRVEGDTNVSLVLRFSARSPSLVCRELS